MDPFRYKSEQKRSKITASVFAILLSSQLCAEEFGSFSIMLNETEQQALQHALGLRKTETPDLYSELASSEEKNAVLFLSAIIYLTSEKWALWLNDQVVNSKTAFPGILVKEVQPDAITFIVEGNAQKEITLKLNQSYSYSQRRVLDGDARLKSSLSN
jgi:hypothetical protein